MNKIRLLATGLFALFGAFVSIGCAQEQQAIPSQSTIAPCVSNSNGTPIDQACAIEVAKAEIIHRERTQPYSRFSADYDAKDATWAIMAIHEPEKPGGHLFILVSRDGKLLDYALGR
jgi:hypothetical protein